MPAASKKTIFTSKLKAKVQVKQTNYNRNMTQKQRARVFEEPSSEEKLHQPCQKLSKLLKSKVELDNDLPESIGSDSEVEEIGSDKGDPGSEV